MGVTGLWRLVEPAGKPVPVETLENKVLAIDISIWLHQVVKGYQDAKGAPLPNAHLMGLFQRLCKLLYFRIKPVFVFDGGFPDLKKETIAKRQDNKAKYNSESERIKRELAVLLSKQTAVSSLLGTKISPKKLAASDNASNDDMFKLPALPQKEEETESESEEEESSGSSIDLHTADIESETFKKLSVKEKYELLIELKETRKMNSWGRLHELPKKSDSFSDFQMQRLLKRRKVQECLVETEKEMGQAGMSLNDLELLLNEEGIDTKIDNLPTRRIASNNTTRFLLINNVRQALADMKRKKAAENETESTTIETQIPSTSKMEQVEEEPDDDFQKAIAMSMECVQDETSTEVQVKKDELDEDLEKAIKMSLECDKDNNADKNTSVCSKTDESWTSFLSDSEKSYSDSEGELEPPDLTSAKAYIMQYSDFTHNAIDEIVTTKNRNVKSKSKTPNVNQIMEELNQNQSIVVENIDISSDEGYDPKKNSSQNNIVELEQSDIIQSETQLIESISNTTEPSLFCVDKTQEIINLDTSSELNDNDTKVDHSETDHNTTNTRQKDSDSSDDEFEEVSDVLPTASKTVVQLTLDVGSSLPEDDIFADVFEDKAVSVHGEEEIEPMQQNDENQKENSSNASAAIQDTNKDLLRTEEVTQESELKKLEDPLTVTTTSKDFTTVAEINTQTPVDKLNNKSNGYLTVTENVLPARVSYEQINHREPMKTPEKVPPKPKLTAEQLNTMVEDMQNEEQDLIQEKGRLDRIGRNITEQMTKEAQELLQVFGIPYIVAPMEAEAQCAFLETVNLTDGTITDDSDIWLFGGRTVYKNFFNQKKHVLQFLAERIEKSFNLTREQLILLALLVGSDYTTGLTGVGPVTAMEILASFPHKKNKSAENSTENCYNQLVTGLKEFKTWLRAGRRTDNISLKKKLKSVTVTDDFPSARVVQAYMEPYVDKNKSKFSWGELDITVLREYARTKFGWNQHKLDEIIKPVMKRVQERKSQKTVDDYFKRKIDFQCLEDQMSKRVKAAVQKMGPEQLLGETVIPSEEKTKVPTKRKPRSKKDLNAKEPSEPGVSKPKQRKKNEALDNEVCANIVTQIQDNKSSLEIKIPKTGRSQEIIPQRQKDIKNLLQNKMKAIEVFRKSKIDTKHKRVKRKPNLPKDKADLSESSDSE